MNIHTAPVAFGQHQPRRRRDDVRAPEVRGQGNLFDAATLASLRAPQSTLPLAPRGGRSTMQTMPQQPHSGPARYRNPLTAVWSTRREG